MSKWNSGNRTLTQDEMIENGKNVTIIFSMAGMSATAIAALLGNMQAESGVNPGIWENFEEFVGGYGLVQWTPYTKYTDWAGNEWRDNGDLECRRIIYEMQNGLQWISTVDYPETFEEFWVSNKNSRYLAQAFVKNYERPESLDQDYRSDYAEWWYNNVTKGAINQWYLFMQSDWRFFKNGNKKRK